nr:MAG TPA: hypothetical protein [Caudoviricetes sp.]
MRIIFMRRDVMIFAWQNENLHDNVRNHGE